MSDLHVKYLLVGGGPASSAAALAIRSVDHDGPVLWVSREVARPYHRPLLARQFLRGQVSYDQLFTLPPTWFDDNRVQLRTGQRVSALDPNRSAIILESGETIAFDNALLALGATPRHLNIPGAQWPNVLYLRTIDDAQRIHNTVEKSKAEGRPHGGGRGRTTVIGAGRLGIELAASLRQLGLAVDLVCDKPHPWAKVGGETIGKFIARYFERKGVTVHTDCTATRLEGDGRAQRVVLSNGETIDTDFVVAAIGIVPNKELLRNTPVQAEKAILTDARCRTNIGNVFAAGDCAAVFDPIYEKHRLMDQWQMAEASGRVAGLNMAGQSVEMSEVAYLKSEMFDLTLQSWGDARFVHHRLVRGSPTLDAPHFAEIGISEDGRVAQVVCVGEPEDEAIFARLVKGRVAVNGNAEQLKDPNVPLSRVLDLPAGDDRG